MLSITSQRVCNKHRTCNQDSNTSTEPCIFQTYQHLSLQWPTVLQSPIYLLHNKENFIQSQDGMCHSCCIWTISRIYCHKLQYTCQTFSHQILNVISHMINIFLTYNMVASVVVRVSDSWLRSHRFNSNHCTVTKQYNIVPVTGR